jgi:hypothetical protein
MVFHRGVVRGRPPAAPGRGSDRDDGPQIELLEPADHLEGRAAVRVLEAVAHLTRRLARRVQERIHRHLLAGVGDGVHHQLEARGVGARDELVQLRLRPLDVVERLAQAVVADAVDEDLDAAEAEHVAPRARDQAGREEAFERRDVRHVVVHAQSQRKITGRLEVLQGSNVVRTVGQRMDGRDPLRDEELGGVCLH